MRLRAWARKQQAGPKCIVRIRDPTLRLATEILARTIWIGEAQAKGYMKEDFMEVFQLYIPQSEVDALLAESRAAEGRANQAASGEKSADATDQKPADRPEDDPAAA